MTNITEDLVSKGKQTYYTVFKPKEVILDHGKGSRVWDLEGKDYIDLGTGIAVNMLGHQHPDLMETLINQSQKLWHTSNLYFTESTIKLADELVRVSFADRVFFSNSGAEANEAAIKFARKYSTLNHGNEKREIITFYGSFHGRTLATITATAQPKYQEGFGPLPGGFIYCPFNDFEAVEKTISDKTCAVLIEPIQGEGGINVAEPGFLGHIQALCQKHQALLIFDEIQSGMGRTGKFLAYEWEDNIKPDIVTLAKALGCGLPLGATLTTQKIADSLKVGDHGTTFGGNPIVTALALVGLKKIHDPKILNNIKLQSENIIDKLKKLNQSLDVFKEIRGKGLMIGAELKGELEGKAGKIMDCCQEQGVLILTAGSNVLRFLPPLNISDEEMEEGFQRLKNALTSMA